MKIWIYVLLSLIFGSQMVEAAVVQSAQDAFSNDIFVSDSNKVIKARKKKISRIKKDKENSQTKESNIKSDKKTLSSDKKDESDEKETSSTSQKNEKAQTQSKTQQMSNPNAGYGYTQKYASKLFQTFSGYITIEQKNIPNRLGVTKGSFIQFNLEEIPESIWSIEIDENIGKILKNEVVENQRVVVIQIIASGNTRLFLDNISVKDNKYRTIYSKKMSLLVDE